MEEVDTITVAVSGIDINKIEPLDTRRLVTFINHYLATTVSFLNHFATQCESKLDRMQQQLHRVECRLKLLECKLASIPGIPSTPTVEAAAAAAKSSAPVPGPSSNNTSNASSSVNANPEPNHPPPSAFELNQPSSSAAVSTSESNQKKDAVDASDESQVEDDTKSGTSASASAKDDPRYAKYFKMITVGVPVQAVKLKMMSEGIDPSVLDN